MNNKQTISMLETVFLVMVVVTNLMPHTRAVDASHAHNAAVFRMVVTLIGLAGMATVWVWKRKASQATPPPIAPVVVPPGLSWATGDGRQLSVTYSGTRADHWRCNLYMLTHSAVSLATLLFVPLAFCFGLRRVLAPHPLPIQAAVCLLVVAAWGALLCAAIWQQIVQRLPRPDSVRTCVTTLSAQGLVDQTPDGTVLIPWTQIKAVREHEGDLYFVRGMGAGQFVPRSAFRDRGEGQEYCRTAQSLCRSRGTVWPVPDGDTEVWPPPVRPSADRETTRP